MRPRDVTCYFWARRLACLAERSRRNETECQGGKDLAFKKLACASPTEKADWTGRMVMFPIVQQLSISRVKVVLGLRKMPAPWWP